jgi:predicted transcriptional regulator
MADRRRKKDRKTHQIVQLWERSQEIVGMASTGMKYTEIAAELNVTPQTVSNTLNSELGKQKLADLRQQRDEEYGRIQRRIRDLSDKAVDTVEQILDMDEQAAHLKLRAALDVLDRSGHKPADKSEHKHVHALVNSEAIKALKERGKRNMEVIDVSPLPETR